MSRFESLKGLLDFGLILLSLNSTIPLVPARASSGLADLVPGNIVKAVPGVNSTHVCQGATTRFQSIVKNQGIGGTNTTFALLWYVKDSANNTVSSQIQQPYGPLGSGANQTTRFDWTASPVSSGFQRFTVGIYVDVYNQVVESNENNNRNETVFLVGNWLECKINYEITPRDYSSRSVVPGESANFTLDVKLTFGYPQIVNLTVPNSAVLFTRGITTRFTVNSSLLNFTSILIVKTKTSTALGSYSISVKGISQNNTVNFTSTAINVQSAFSIGPQTLIRGEAINASALVRVHGTSVRLGARVDGSDPSASNMALTFNPSSINLARNETEESVTISLRSFDNTTAKNYVVSLLAAGDEVNGTGTFNLHVVPLSDYFIVINPRACALDPRSANRDCKVDILIYSGGRYNGTVTLIVSPQSGVDLLVSSTKNSTQSPASEFRPSFLILGSRGKTIQNYTDTITLHVRSGHTSVYTVDFSTESNATLRPELAEFNLILLKDYAPIPVPALQPSATLILLVMIALFPTMIRRRRYRSVSAL